MDILVEPNEFMAGYSAIPIRVSDTGATSTERFKYVTNLLWDKKTISTANGRLLTFTTPHNFKVGDTVFLDDDFNANQKTGYYIITSIGPLSVLLNINITAVSPLGVNPAFLTKVIKYKMSPDLEGEAKLDIGNVIKDFLTEDLEDVNEVFNAPNTVFDYDLSIGKSARAIFYFETNTNVGGRVAFVNSTIVGVGDVPFRVGDYVYIEQERDEWDYYDNFFRTGNVGFTGITSPHNFVIGSSIFVQGQITNPTYNGFKTVTEVVDIYSIRTDEPWVVGTPVEGGTILGTSRPSYNGSAQILSISYVIGLGMVVVIDKPFTTAVNTPIPGYMRSNSDIAIDYFNEIKTNNKRAYNARISNLDYSVDAFSEYVVAPITMLNPVSENNISTILRGTYKHRIEQSTKSWLLVHKNDSLLAPPYTGIPYFDFYDASGTLLSKNSLSGSTTVRDYYYPVGIDQLLNSTNLNLISGSTLSAITNDISYYETYLGDSTNNNIITNTIFFELNDDCSKFDIYHLMWKDKYGSWLSYPFIYLSRNRTEVERKTYYKTEGNWDDNTFGYESYGRGEKNYFSRSRDKLIVNSGWLEDQEVFLMKDLMQSASVYVQLPTGKLVACTLEENEIESKRGINDQIFSYSFNVRLSNNDIRL